MSKKFFNRMIVVAGPTVCGKTTFINQLMSGKLKCIEALLQINDLKNWVYQDVFFLNKKQFQKKINSKGLNVIFHWTIPLPNFMILFRNMILFGKYDKELRIKFVKGANEVCVLTLYAEPSILLERLNYRAKRWDEILKENSSLFYKKIMKHWSISTTRKFYLNYHRCLPAYTRWFEFVNKIIKPKMNFLVDVNYTPLIRNVKDWANISENLFGLQEDG